MLTKPYIEENIVGRYNFYFLIYIFWIKITIYIMFSLFKSNYIAFLIMGTIDFGNKIIGKEKKRGFIKCCVESILAAA